MKLSIIIPFYNAADTLGEQLEALAAEHWQGEWEVILGDNGSTDGSIDVAKSFEGRIPNMRLVDASGRQGAAHARNKAIEVAQGEILGFVDADDVIGRGWVAAMAQASEKHDFMSSRFEYEKLCNDPGQNYCGGTQVNGFQRMWWPPFYPHSGACGLVVKRSLYDAVGGFDENWLVLQDTDFCIRLYQHGARLHFVPEAVMHIRSRSSHRAIFRQAKRWGQYNVLLYKRYRLEDDKLPKPIRRYCRDAYKALMRFVRHPRNTKRIYQLGWHVGLLKGCLMYRVAPPVVGLVSIPEDLNGDHDTDIKPSE